MMIIPALVLTLGAEAQSSDEALATATLETAQAAVEVNAQQSLDMGTLTIPTTDGFCRYRTSVPLGDGYLEADASGAFVTQITDAGGAPTPGGCYSDGASQFAIFTITCEPSSSVFYELSKQQAGGPSILFSTSDVVHSLGNTGGSISTYNRSSGSQICLTGGLEMQVGGVVDIYGDAEPGASVVIGQISLSANYE